MRIKSIGFTNFKGGSKKYLLSPITVFVGNNFAGKSSITEASTLANAGYLPGIEKKPGMIFERLASGNPMAVINEFDDGKNIARTYEQDDKGGVKCKVNSRGLPTTFAIDPVLIDATEFLGLSSKERNKFLSQRLPMAGEVPTPSSIFEELSKNDIVNTSEEAAKIVAEMEEELIKDHEEAVTSGLPPQVWLESAVLKINDWKRGAVSQQATAVKVAAGTPKPEMQAFDKTAIKNRIKTAQEGVKAASKALEDARVAQRSAKSGVDVTVEQRAMDKAEVVLNEARAAYKVVKKELNEVINLKCCPKCGAKNKGWQAKLKKLAQHAVKTTELSGLEAAKQFKAAEDAMAEKQKLIASASAEQAKELQAALDGATAAHSAANQEYIAASNQNILMERQEEQEVANKKRQEASETLNLKVEVLKLLCDLSATALDKMVADSIQPFLVKVNELCGGILPGDIAYANGELGMVKGRFVSWKSFSGTERALFYCAVSIALAAESALRLVTLDEMGRLDETNRLKVLARLVELVTAEKIDQCILIDAGNLGWWQQMSISESPADDQGFMSVIEVK